MRGRNKTSNAHPRRAARVRTRPETWGTRAQDEAGMSLIELVVALTLLAIVMTALVGTIGVSFKSVQLARARQVAEAAANKRLEELRDVDYPQLALATLPTHNPSANNPDHFVTGSTYDYSGEGSSEQMIVETDPAGPVVHIESPVTVGGTVVNVYQYVTWVDQPEILGSQNLKRITVVVEYHSVAIPGTAHLLRESVLFTPGTVTMSPPSTSSSTTTTTLPPSTTTTTVPPGGCGSFAITGGGGGAVTAVPTVTLSLNLSGCGESIYMNFSNDGTTWGSDLLYDPLNPATAWTITGSDGLRVISGRARNTLAGIPWILNQQEIILDTTPPTTPGTLNRTLSCSGSTRTVTLSWSASSDLYFVGYRVYRSTNGSTWQVVSSTSYTYATDSHLKSLTSVRFYVKAYDSAGNESNATNTISLAKHQCS